MRAAKLSLCAIAAAVAFADIHSAFAAKLTAQNRGRQHTLCVSEVSSKGLKGQAKKDEIDKCMLDPVGYK